VVELLLLSVLSGHLRVERECCGEALDAAAAAAAAAVGGMADGEVIGSGAREIEMDCRTEKEPSNARTIITCTMRQNEGGRRFWEAPSWSMPWSRSIAAAEWERGRD
jgi:hypothetical protein